MAAGTLPMFWQPHRKVSNAKTENAVASNVEEDFILKNALQRVEDVDEASIVFCEDANAFAEDQLRCACRLALAEEQLLSVAHGLKHSAKGSRQTGEMTRDVLGRCIEDAMGATKTVSSDLAVSMERLRKLPVGLCGQAINDVQGCADIQVFGTLHAHLAAFHQDCAAERNDRENLRDQWFELKDNLNARLQDIESRFEQQSTIDEFHSTHIPKDMDARMQRLEQCLAQVSDELRCMHESQAALVDKKASDVQAGSDQGVGQGQGYSHVLPQGCSLAFDCSSEHVMKSMQDRVLEEARRVWEVELSGLEQRHRECQLEFSKGALDSVKDSLQEQLKSETVKFASQYSAHLEQSIQQLESCVRNHDSKLREVLEALEQQGALSRGVHGGGNLAPAEKKSIIDAGPSPSPSADLHYFHKLSQCVTTLPKESLHEIPNGQLRASTDAHVSKTAILTRMEPEPNMPGAQAKHRLPSWVAAPGPGTHGGPSTQKLPSWVSEPEQTRLTAQPSKAPSQPSQKLPSWVPPTDEQRSPVRLARVSRVVPPAHAAMSVSSTRIAEGSPLRPARISACMTKQGTPQKGGSSALPFAASSNHYSHTVPVQNCSRDLSPFFRSAPGAEMPTRISRAASPPTDMRHSPRQPS